MLTTADLEKLRQEWARELMTAPQRTFVLGADPPLAITLPMKPRQHPRTCSDE